MAKQIVNGGDGAAARWTMENIPATLAKAVKGITGGVMGLAKELGVAREKSRDLAPKVMDTYRAGAAALGGSFTFVAFARLFDPSIPMHPKDQNGVAGYTTHRVYYALDYMRRAETARTKPRGVQGKRDTATDALARTLATLLQVLTTEAAIAALWSTVAKEFRFGPKVIAALKVRVEATEPVIKIDVPAKAVKVGEAIHMTPAARETAEAPPVEAMAQKGKRVAKAA